MTREEELRNFAQNLRVLCRSFNSVADICRRIDINRQQFNKYLSGQHYPSHRILSQIARFFSIDERELFLDTPSFEKLFEGVQFDVTAQLRRSVKYNDFLPYVHRSVDALRPFYGVYNRYHNSSIYKGRILRSILCLHERDGIAQYHYVERFPALDGSRRTAYLFKYYGVALFLEERIFLIDFEGLQKNEMTFSILMPNYRNALRFLYGLVSGVAATPYREPFATRIVLDYRGPGQIKKQHMKDATAMLPSDTSIPVEVRSHLTEPGAVVIRGGAS
jgi:transcriptional regulator with XRE-family HTH domain